ncbi:MAG: hypothetical protein ACRDZ9_10220 [Acidimicrobiales bacterium]
MRCEELAEVVSASAGRGDLDDRRARRHVESCLRCQAELVQYRKLLKALQTLRAEVFVPASGLVADVLVSLEEAGERHAIRSLVHGRKVVYVGGLAFATAAVGAAGALVLVSRSRSRRLPLAG